MELDAMEFIRRFLQHVLPKRFMKIRHYGFLNPNSALSIDQIRELISLIHDVIRDLLPQIPAYKRRGIKCSHCGHDLRVMFFLSAAPPMGAFRVIDLLARPTITESLQETPGNATGGLYHYPFAQNPIFSWFNRKIQAGKMM